MLGKYEVIVLDTETTGLNNHPVHGHPQVIEVTSMGVNDNLCLLREGLVSQPTVEIMQLLKDFSHTQKFLPSMTIHPEATKIHGYKNADLFGNRKSETIVFPSETKFMVGHQISYDHRCLGKPDVKLICTKQLADVLNKQMKLNHPSGKLDDLIVHYYEEADARLVIKDKHDSFTDCIKVVMLLKKLLEFIPAINSWEELYNFQTILKGKKK